MLRNSLLAKESDEEWVRLPKPGERFWGLSRSTLLELGQLGKIRMAHIRKPGSTRGLRLIWRPSLTAYVESCVEEPKPKPLGARAKQKSSTTAR
jgi:hypothetical protein